MKTTTFIKPLEITIETDRESYRQGERLGGKIYLKNHGANDFELNSELNLCAGHFKRIEKKDPRGLEMLETLKLFDKKSLASNESAIIPYEFFLKEDAEITDKDSSLYLTYGEAKLELVVEMRELIALYLQTLTNFFRFKIVGTKSRGKKIEVKCDPPNSRGMSTIDSLTLLLSHTGNSLDIKYSFIVATLQSAVLGAEVSKVKKDFTQQLLSKDYEFGPGSYNQDALKKAIETILPEALPKLFY